MCHLKKGILLIIVFILHSCVEEQLAKEEYPRLLTSAVEDITSQGAEFKAEISHPGESLILDYGFVWSKNEFPKITNSDIISLGERSNAGVFSTTISGSLQKGALYHVRSYAITENYTVYGNEVTFISQGSLPPKIDSISGSTVSWGDTIYIYGHNFSSYPENNKVLFDSTHAHISNASTEKISALVPSNLFDQSSKISVDVAGMNSVLFKTLNITTSMIWKRYVQHTRDHAISFVCDNIGYVGLGVRFNSFVESMWKYNPIDNSYTSISSFTNCNRKLGVAFSINNLGYIGTGLNDSILSGFVKYNSNNNSFANIQSYANGSKSVYGATAFSIGEYGYVGTGIGQSETYYNDFWKYDPANNIWTEISSFGGEARSQAISFVIGNNAYVGLGKNSFGEALDDIWKYDSLTDTWSKIADYKGDPSWGAISFSINSKGYVGLGSNNTDEIWEYTPEIDSWTRVFHFIGGELYEAEAIVINQKAYILFGSNIDMTQWMNNICEFVP